MQVTEYDFEIGKTIASELWIALNFIVKQRRTPDKDLRITVKSAEELEGSIRGQMTPALIALPKSARDGMYIYFHSGEFQTAIRQTLALRLLRGSQNFLTESRPVVSIIGQSLRTYIKTVPIEFARAVQVTIADACDAYVSAHGRSLDKLLRDPVGLAHIESQVASIEKVRDIFSDADPIESFVKFIQTYEKAAADAYSRIRAPHWDSQVVVPLNKVYIPARLVGPQAYPRTTDGNIFIDRTVILGDPGAGKTTYGIHMAHMILADEDSRFETTAIPFILTLRDYSTPDSVGRFEENIQDAIKARFHVQAPRGAINYLLVSGRAVVIFDGLDELLDTGLRRRVTDSIEGFAATYPNVRILVTSRMVGYNQAPLDPAIFATFHIRPFSHEDIENYTYSWFTLDRWSGEPGNPYERHMEFMRTSKAVADLRSNPLLLALLCNLYRATGYQELPRSRPAVLEKCALMLFDRWDRNRNIGSVDFERDFQPVVASLAYQIFSEQANARGVPEARLIRMAVDFLYPERIGNQESAIAFARSLLDHCRGRAWVLTDVGTTPAGEAIYQFTHRTFLEYFAALHIFRRQRTPEAMAKALGRYIDAAEWGLVPILALQIVDRWLDGASDDFLKALFKSTKRTSAEWANALTFALEVLRTVAVGPRAVRMVARLCVQMLSAGDSPEREVILDAMKRELLPDNSSSFEAGCIYSEFAVSLRRFMEIRAAEHGS